MFNIVITLEEGHDGTILESFGFGTRSFIVNGNQSEAILAQLIREVLRQSRRVTGEITLMVSRNSETRFFKTREILYIESLGNRKCINTPTETFEFYGEMYHIEKLTDRLGFVRVHHAFIVSPEHICSANSRYIIMDNGKIIIIGKKYRSHFKDALREAGFCHLNR